MGQKVNTYIQQNKCELTSISSSAFMANYAAISTTSLSGNNYYVKENGHGML